MLVVRRREGHVGDAEVDQAEIPAGRFGMEFPEEGDERSVDDLFDHGVGAVAVAEDDGGQIAGPGYAREGSRARPVWI